MMSFLSRYRYALGGMLSVVLLAVILVQTLPFVHMAWDTFTGSPDLRLVQDVRHVLLDQEPFRKMLADHERDAVRRHLRGGPSAYQKRHLVRVNLTPFGLPGFHDLFAVRVRTDIVDGKAYTSFLARPGVVFDPNAASFFSGQCEGSLCKSLIRLLVGTGHTLLAWGVLTPYRMNITEMDETSSISIGTEAISTSAWSQKSRTLHQKQRGRSFVEDPSQP
jgi:hypothetical protein